MSVLGTGVIAGVAQTSLQAQQVARQRQKPVEDMERARQRINEILELRLHGMGEDDDAAPSSTALHTDAVLPDHQRPPFNPDMRGAPAEHGPVEPDAAGAEAYAKADPGEQQPPRLDVKA